MPVDAKLSLVSEEIWLSPEILEVMRIDTLSLVVLMIIGTPFSLEVEYVEVKVGLAWKQIMNQPDFDVFYAVGKGAVLSILAIGKAYSLRLELL